MSKNKRIGIAQGIQYPVRLLSLDDACRYLSCSLDTLEELISMGELPIIRLGLPPAKGRKERRKRWVDKLDLDIFIESKKERIGKWSS